jgi:hypothetical protein
MRIRLTAAVLVGSLLTALLPALHLALGGPVDVHGQEVEAAVSHQQVIALPFEASHVALRWTGAPDAHLSIAFGERADAFGEDVDVSIDDDAQGAPGEVFSGVLWTGGATFARVTTDAPIAALKVLAMDAGQQTLRAGGSDASAGGGGLGAIDLGAVADAATTMPPIISRADWGANESYRFNSGGYEIFPSTYYPLQKVIVHHTASRNDDPDPEATIRAIYYMHAVSRGWGDIDYNFLIDWQGRIYEGRHSRKYASGEPITGEDLAGNVARGAHARGFNDGTVGIALLGNFQKILPPLAQRAALEKLIAWKLERHGINPLGASTYTNPNLGTSTYLQNISGHRNVNATDCPGDTFYNWFPTLRQNVANRIAATTGSTVDHTAPSVISLKPMVPNGTGATSIPFGLLFKEPVTGLTASDFSVGGTSPGWTIASVTGKASGYTITLDAPGGGTLPPPGSVTLTLADSSVKDLAANVGPGAAVTGSITYAHDDVAPTFVMYQEPHRSATNAALLDWSVTFDEPVIGFTPSDIHLGGPDASEWQIEWLLGQDGSYEFVTQQPTLSNGTFTVSLPAGFVTDLAGNPAPASPVVTIKVDRSKPTTGTPKVQLRSGTTLNGTALRVGVIGAGTDTGPAGIGSYDVRRSLDAGAYSTIGTVAAGDALPWSMTPGHTYRFEIRAHDRAGNVGSWVAGPTLHPALTQQTSSSVHWSGATQTLTSSSYSGGSLRSLNATGASATYTTSARSLSFVTSKGPTRGTAEVWVDGVLQATVVLTASSTTYRYVAFAKTWSSVGTHTIRIVSVGSPARVDVDAFGVIR